MAGYDVTLRYLTGRHLEMERSRKVEGSRVTDRVGGFCRAARRCGTSRSAT